MSILKTTSTCNVLHCVEDKFKQNNVEIQGGKKSINQAINKSHKPIAEDKSQTN